MALVMTVTPIIAEAEITVTDVFGYEVTLAKPAERIVSLAPHTTENLFSAGAGARIVGVGAHSDYPPAAQKIPSFGNHAQINLEALISLSPDLIVAWQTGQNRSALEKIARLGFAVYRSEPRTFDGIIDNINEYAKLAGSTPTIDATKLREELKQLREKFAARNLMRVFYLAWREPLMTLNGEDFISRALTICGAKNIFASRANNRHASQHRISVSRQPGHQNDGQNPQRRTGYVAMEKMDIAIEQSTAKKTISSS